MPRAMASLERLQAASAIEDEAASRPTLSLLKKPSAQGSELEVTESARAHSYIWRYRKLINLGC